ncbi:hypothetical protein DM084_30130, partial [Klebsiella pneumoniae]
MSVLKFIKYAALGFVLAAATSCWAGTPVEFSPEQGVKAALRVEDGKLLYEITTGSGPVIGSVDTQTEKPIHIEIGDYEFSGRKGFSFWSIDEG